MTDHGAWGCGVPEGVVATSLNLSTGAKYEITLQGAQRWVRIARILSVLPDVLVLELDDGRQLTVPQAAIISARPLTGAGLAPRGSELSPVRTGGPPARTGGAPARAVTVSPPVHAEPFYFTYINEKGSDVSAAWLLDLRTRLLKDRCPRRSGQAIAGKRLRAS